MSREVCGICFCPYGDEGDCACQQAPATELREQQEPVEVKQIAEALRQVGLTLVRTNGGFRVMDLGCIKAQTASPPTSKPWVELTELEALGAYEAEQQGRWGDHVRGLLAVEAKLREKNT